MERDAEAVFFECLRAKRSDRPPCLLKAFTSQLAGTLEMARSHRRLTLAHCFPNRFKLDNHSRETLRQGVMHFPGQAISLSHHSRTPTFFREPRQLQSQHCLFRQCLSQLDLLGPKLPLLLKTNSDHACRLARDEHRNNQD